MARVVITQGDPNGVGPDLLLWLAASGHLEPGDVVVADGEVLRERADRLPADYAPGGLAAIEPRLDPVLASASPGPAAILERAVDLVRSEPNRALVTAPIHKADMPRDAFPFPGHTEFLAARDGVPAATMAFFGPRLRLALATVHVPLARVPRVLSESGVVTAVVRLAQALAAFFDVRHPRIAVLGLNPHAGEDGRLGDEEIRIVAPAVERARAELPKATVTGPLSADGFFSQLAPAAYDGVVAMYHDQGLVPFKLLHGRDGVHVTLGLSFVRTSPDHGTAREIAGTGRADPASTVAALRVARGRRPYWKDETW